MSAGEIAILLAGAACGGFVSGLAGFGYALFSLGWWLQILPPVQAVAVVLVMSVISGVQGMVEVRRSIEVRPLARFLVPALIGIPLGLQVLYMVDAAVLKPAIGLFMLVYGAFFVFRRDLPKLSGAYPVADAAIGFIGGVLGAIAGLSGALPTIWISLRGWGKQQARAVLQPFNFAVLGISTVMLAATGAYDRPTLWLMAMAAPVSIAASWVGIRTFRRLNDAQFRRLLIVLIFAAGVSILLREAAAIG